MQLQSIFSIQFHSINCHLLNISGILDGLVDFLFFKDLDFRSSVSLPTFFLVTVSRTCS